MLVASVATVDFSGVDFDFPSPHARRLTVDVYQTHGRIALESGDMEEYNQCQSRLRELHLAGVSGVSMDEFTGYRLIYSLYRENHR